MAVLFLMLGSGSEAFSSDASGRLRPDEPGEEPEEPEPVAVGAGSALEEGR